MPQQSLQWSAIFGQCSHMICIVVGDKGLNLGIDMRTASQSQFSFFQQQDCCALRQDKAIALGIVRARCSFWLVITRAQSMYHIEDSQPNRSQCGISTPSQHAFGTPLLDLPAGLTNGIPTSRTASSDGQTGTTQTVVGSNYR